MKDMKETPPSAGKGAPNLFYYSPMDNKGGPCQAPDCDIYMGYIWPICWTSVPLMVLKLKTKSRRRNTRARPTHNPLKRYPEPHG